MTSEMVSDLTNFPHSTTIGSELDVGASHVVPILACLANHETGEVETLLIHRAHKGSKAGAQPELLFREVEAQV
jgi:hypothetical protein